MLKSEPKCITISAQCILVQHYGLLAIYTINCKLFVRGLCNIYFYVCLILFSQMVIFMSVMYVYTFMADGSYLLSNKAYMSVWVTIKQNLTHHLFSRKMTVPSLEYYSCLTLYSVGFIDLELTFEYVFLSIFLILVRDRCIQSPFCYISFQHIEHHRRDSDCCDAHLRQSNFILEWNGIKSYIFQQNIFQIVKISSNFVSHKQVNITHYLLNINI